MSLPDLLFPRRCLGCGKVGQYFCQDCQKNIIPIEKQICPVCEKPAISGLTHPGCQTKYTLDGLTSIFPYEGIIKAAISKLKYRFVTDLAQDLVGLINWTTWFKNSILIPVPLYPRRERWRGFNQSEVLGKLLADKFGWQMRTDILVRVRYTQPQIRFKENNRKENIHGAFKISPQFAIRKLDNWQLVVFDDVWTTGSTLKECGQVLKKAVAKKVWGLTVAR